MLWKLGWLTGSLKYRVNKDIHDTLFQNKNFLSQRGSVLDRLIIAGAQQVVWASLLMLITAVLIACLLVDNYAVIQAHLPASLNGLSSIIDFQSTLFGAQITFIGLIFPLVIAFIGVLLQGKSANESLWTVYRHHSGFMLVGFSALTLCLGFVIIKLCEPWLPYRARVAAAVCATLWFVINLLLSARFLSKTVAFLSLNARMRIIVQYAISQVLASDIRNRLLSAYCKCADQKGLLFKPKSHQLKVKSLTMTELPNKIENHFPKPRVVSNVWYPLLNMGIRLWACQQSPNKTLTLHLPFCADGVARKEIVYAETDGNPIDPVAAFLIKAAIKTTDACPQPLLNIKQIISALFSQIEDALKENNVRLFDVAIDDLVQFQSNIEASTVFTDDNGAKASWLLQPDEKLLGGSFLEIFIRESIKIARQVTRRIADNANYYEAWCRFYLRLFNRHQVEQPVAVAQQYLNGHYQVWVQLMVWIAGFNSKDSVAAQQIDRAIKHFIGTWEGWGRYLLKDDSNSVKDNLFSLRVCHLTKTSCMVISASQYDNQDAARWAADVLCYWFDLFFSNRSGYAYHDKRSELMTLNTQQLALEHPLRTFILGNAQLEEKATSIALKNYWTDVRILTAAYLLATSESKACGQQKQLIDALVSGKRLEPTSPTESNRVPINRMESLLDVYLRQYGDWGGQADYKKRLEEHLNVLVEIEEPAWIPLRIYASEGKQDRYVPTLFKIIGIGLTNNPFNIHPQWLDFFKSDAVSSTNLENTVFRLEALLSDDETIIERVAAYFDLQLEEAKKQSEQFVQSIKGIIIELKSILSEQITSAPIDQDRLLAIARAASESTFTLAAGPLPLPLFQQIEYRDTIAADIVKCDTNSFQKRQISAGIDVPQWDDSNWFKEKVAKRVTQVCFQQLLNQPAWKTSRCENANRLILKAVGDGQLLKEQGLSPILFVGPRDVCKSIELSMCQYGPEEQRLPVDIRVDTGRSYEYLCHIEGIEVYDLSVNQLDVCLLLCKEAFRKILIKRFEEQRYVNATFKTAQDTDLYGTLALEFGIECEFAESACFFKYISQESDL